MLFCARFQSMCVSNSDSYYCRWRYCLKYLKGTMMKLAYLLLSLMVFLVACDKSTQPESNDTALRKPATTLEAAWLGKGTFKSKYGTKDVTVQLELLSNHRYRHLILKPRVLMLTGLEQGTWSQDGDQVQLIPDSDKPKAKRKPGEKPSLRLLLQGAPRNLQPKTLTVVGHYKSLVIKDRKMDIEFKHNKKATAKLLASGDI